MNEQQIKGSILSDGHLGADLNQTLLKTGKKENRFDGLDNIMMLGYGVGHCINDLTVTCWFNYFFFFLKKVVKTTAAPTALLVGQIADSITTPLVGYLSDKTKTKYGYYYLKQGKELHGILSG